MHRACEHTLAHHLTFVTPQVIVSCRWLNPFNSEKFSCTENIRPREKKVNKQMRRQAHYYDFQLVVTVFFVRQRKLWSEEMHAAFTAQRKGRNMQKDWRRRMLPILVSLNSHLNASAVLICMIYDLFDGMRAAGGVQQRAARLLAFLIITEVLYGLCYSFTTLAMCVETSSDDA